MNEHNKVSKLDLCQNIIGDDGVRFISTALMNENNKVTRLNLSDNYIGDDGVQSLSMALMHENNKVSTLYLSGNYIGGDGARYLSTALMNENNKVSTLKLRSNAIGAPGAAALLKILQFSLVSHLEMENVISYRYNRCRRRVYSENESLLKFCNDFNKYIPRLVCVASVRTIPRIAGYNCYFRMLSSDLLIRIAQTLGWLIDSNETIRILEELAS